MLQGKKILLGITGSIAAYKTPHLVRLLKKEGAQVRVVLTSSACNFVTPVALSTVSQNPVVSDFYKDKSQGTWENHVELGLWPDLFLIAPLTANSLSKMVRGEADNILLATWLSAKSNVMVAPAMDLDMYKHFSTTGNLLELQKRGVEVLDSPSGELASGLSGKGRMLEPEDILEEVVSHFKKANQLKGKRILITAGPTYEAIDPVRFVGNHSSGKMGFSLAKECANRGAEVVLVAGPVSLGMEHPQVKRIDVISAREMFEVCTKEFSNCNAAILSAAVADYRPLSMASEKIKKQGDEFTLKLVKNPDILQSLGSKKNKNQLLVGFALETENEKENAKAKLLKKNLDFIVLNSLKDEGAGFKSDTNRVTIIDRNNKSTKYELKSKQKVAEDIIDYLYSLI